MLTRRLLIVASALICSTLSPLVYGQANGSLSGTVADKTGGVLTGATVKITSQATGLERDAKTDPRAELSVPLLVDGSVWGVLNIEAPEPDAFGEADAVLVEAIAASGMAR